MNTGGKSSRVQASICIQPAITSRNLVLLPASRRLAAAGQARETMEAHMYGFLTQRYGLRPLILGALAGLLAALARHRDHDANVDLFGRVLRYRAS